MEFNSKLRKFILAVSGEIGLALELALVLFVVLLGALEAEMKGTASAFREEIVEVAAVNVRMGGATDGAD